MCPLPTNCVDQMFAEEGSLKNTTGHMILEKKKGFNYRTLLGELMYAYITCHPDIRYAITTLSNNVIKIFFCTYWIPLHIIERSRDLFTKYYWIGYLIDVEINCLIITGFVDAAHTNKLRK